MRFSCNGWPYVHLGDGISFTEVIRRINGCGIKGFDLCVGMDAYPKMSFEASLDDIYRVKSVMDEIGSYTASVVLISFPLNDVKEMVRQLNLGSFLANIMAAPRLHMLPRRYGTTRGQAWDNLREAWRAAGDIPKNQGLPVSIENHVTSDEPENDIFFFRNSMDFMDLIDKMNGAIRIKYDPAWLMKAGDDPFKLLPQLIRYIEILDLKDYSDGKFVEPGKGGLDFVRLFNTFYEYDIRIPDISVEVEEHHFFAEDVLDADKIDSLIVRARIFYEKLLGI